MSELTVGWEERLVANAARRCVLCDRPLRVHTQFVATEAEDDRFKQYRSLTCRFCNEDPDGFCVIEEMGLA